MHAGVERTPSSEDLRLELLDTLVGLGHGLRMKDCRRPAKRYTGHPRTKKNDGLVEALHQTKEYIQRQRERIVDQSRGHLVVTSNERRACGFKRCQFFDCDAGCAVCEG